MKVSWEIEDVKPGRVIQKADCGLTGSWMIGYRYYKDENILARMYGLVSLADGMFMELGALVEVMTYLNEHKELVPLELTNVTIEFNAEAD